MANTTHLIFHLDSELDSLVAVIPTGDDFLPLMERRFSRLVNMAEDDELLEEMVFGANGTLYHRNEEIDAWCTKNMTSRGPSPAYVGYCLTETELPPVADAEERTATLGVHLTRHGSYYWTFLPKHSEETLETPPLQLSGALQRIGRNLRHPEKTS